MVTSHTDSGRRYEHAEYFTEDFTGDVKVTVYSGEVEMEGRALRGVVTLAMDDLIDIVAEHVRQWHINDVQARLDELTPAQGRQRLLVDQLKAELGLLRSGNSRDILGLQSSRNDVSEG